MKILIFPFDLVVCGVTVNAIDLASALRDLHGHEIVLFATPGPLVKLAEKKGLRFIPAPAARLTPSLARMRALRKVVQWERPELIHVWDWRQCIDAYYFEHLLMGIPLVVTEMAMTLQRMLPKAVPTTFGTPDLVEGAKRAGYRQVELILPPVDISLDAPDAVNPQPFRTRCGLSNGDIVLVTVSRLDNSMKAESLIGTLDVVAQLGREMPLRFVMVGDGDARPELERRAERINANLGRHAVVFTGALADPRPAYAAADIFVGMGGSALRAMAFGKPVIVVGERGFSATFSPKTAEYFYRKGFYGIGDGTSNNAGLLTDVLELAANPHSLPKLGAFSREFVLKHFALETVSARLSAFYSVVAANQRQVDAAMADGLRTAAIWVRERRWVPRAP
ncbi:MAG: glycosyltransferase [Beijerinckiaceae bacterium]|nr:glycosyltransferase [Beijerinckiaceae bacterium]MCI0734728.1 glycosyltransferase [Beijerinckiaceae bacterium]